MLITDSRGYFDALTRSESPQVRLRSSRTGEEARGIKEQCAVSDARIHWVNTSTMLADSLTKTGYPARAVIESFLVKKRLRFTFDPAFESGRRWKARCAPLFNQEDLDEINPLTESVAFDTLLQNESLSEDVREIIRVISNDIDVSPQSGQRSRKSFGACKTCTDVSCQQISILTLNFNTSFVGHLTNIATREYHVDRVFLRLC